LHRLSASDDIVIGSPFSGRSDPDFENQIGLFVNPLVFRTKIDDNNSFNYLLQDVKDSSTRVLQHKDFPFELLIGDLRDGWEQHSNSLFNVRFLLDEGEIQMNNFERRIAITDGLTLRQVEYYPAISIHDISFIFSKQEKLKVSLQYNTSLFAEETIELIKARLLKLVALVIERPEIKISQLDLRIEVEIQQDAMLSSLLNTDEAF
jgi:non-ribosomal peptide synthetase component F